MERWYRNAVIYSLDVGTFQDSNGDGVGDIPGLISRLDYLFTAWCHRVVAGADPSVTTS